jgi:hypothetical protein
MRQINHDLKSKEICVHIPVTETITILVYTKIDVVTLQPK